MEKMSDPCLIAGLYVIVGWKQVHYAYPMPDASMNHPSDQLWLRVLTKLSQIERYTQFHNPPLGWFIIGLTTLEMYESVIFLKNIKVLWLKLLSSTILNMVHKSFARGRRSRVQKKSFLPPLHDHDSLCDHGEGSKAGLCGYFNLGMVNGHTEPLEPSIFVEIIWGCGLTIFPHRGSAWLNMQDFGALCESNHSILTVGWFVILLVSFFSCSLLQDADKYNQSWKFKFLLPFPLSSKSCLWYQTISCFKPHFFPMFCYGVPKRLLQCWEFPCGSTRFVQLSCCCSYSSSGLVAGGKALSV